MWLGVAAMVMAVGPGTVVDWRAPPPCPSASDVLTRIDGLLVEGHDRSAPSGVRITARVSASAQLWTLDLAIESPSGSESQTLVAKSCDALADAVAVQAALAIDASHAAEQRREPSRAPPPPANKPPPPPAREPTRSARPRLGARAAFAIGSGPLPAPTSKIGGVGWVAVGRWRVELGGGYGFARPARFATVPDAGADLRLGVGDLRTCFVARVGAVRLPYCAGLQLGSLRADGVGLEQPGRSRRLWAAIELAPSLVWPFSRWVGVWAGASAAAALVRPSFSVGDLGRVYRAPPVVAQIAFGLEIARWWDGS